MAADTPGLWQILNGLAQKVFAPVTLDASQSITPQFAPRTNGGPVEVSNPLPVAVQGGSISGSVVVTQLPSPPSVSDSSGNLVTVASVVTPTANGATLGVLPVWASGVRFYLAAGDSVTFAIDNIPPTSPPTTVTVSGNLTSGTGPNWDEKLSAGQQVFITAVTGAPKFRWSR